MLKNLLLFIGLLISIIISFNNLSAETISLIPLKKPVLSNDEFNKKISKNIIKPIKKPKKDKIVSIEKKKIIKTLKETKLSFKIPKKKPSIAGINTSKNIKISKYYSKKDFGIAKKAISEMQKSKWTTSLKIAKKAKDKSIYNFIQWKHLLTSGNQASFYDYKVFIDQNSKYPRIGRLKYLAEHKLSTAKISPKKIIDWFDGKEPLSGYGKMIIGESFVLTGNKDKGKKLIKEGWITADLSKNELKFFRKKFKKYLNADDYIKRADYLAWNNKYWDLKRLLRYLPKDYELLYTARQILMTRGYGVDQAIKNVPEKFKNDAGLNYDRLKWRRKRGRVDSSLEILLSIKNDKNYLVEPEKWWKEREIISRALIYKKKYETAYKISSNHGMSKGSDFAAAEWMSGWIALSFLNDPLIAKDHFQNFYNNVNYPISTSRGAYWLGRTYEELGNKEQSVYWYDIASKYLTTYYGQLAFLKLDPSGKFELNKDMKIDNKYRYIFFNKELVKITYLLDELKKDKYTKFILRHLANDNIQKGSEVLAAELATNIQRYDFAIQISKISSYQKRFHNKFNYPIISTPKKINGRKIPESAFILSIIRQESEFDLSANSHAGAKGLMQLMPYTAKLVSKQAKLPYSKSRLTSDPEYNINLGSHYIAGLILQYEGAYPFAIAAYNAGPNRVKYWKKINKNPQKKQINYVDWVELIKFRETRNYVQRVLENYNVYRYILEKKPIPMKDFFKDQPLF
ncbi:lytic transglycosylase domain-containing protein [Candidatus Pelagibacter bacterium nBUS_36]|uniref:lytic transglycosylase domain-containing protein n=1 Tax=Candidatus Pelagibacter bacterium nBUS_36 TaxID=3374194 RepID=UPI003EBF2D42